MLIKKQYQLLVLLKAVLNSKNLAGITLVFLSFVTRASSVQAAEEKARRADDFVDSV